jgi:hypothetical protein
MKTGLDLRRWAQQAHCNKTQSQPSTSAVRSTHTLTHTPILSLSLALAGKGEREWEKRRPKHTFWLTPFRRSSSIYRAKSLLLCENKHFFFFSFQFRFYPHPFPVNTQPVPPMAPSTSSSSAAPAMAKRLIRFSGSLRRTEAPRRPTPPPSPPPKKLKPMAEVMAKAGFAVLDRGDYSKVSCEQCRSGERPDELLLCDKCDKGFHMKCLRPIVVRVPIGSWLCPKCSGNRRVRSTLLFASFLLSLLLEWEMWQCGFFLF